MPNIDPKALQERAASMAHHHEARTFATEHPASGLPLSDAFRDTLTREVAKGEIDPAQAGEMLEEQIIEEAFNEQAEDRN